MCEVLTRKSKVCSNLISNKEIKWFRPTWTSWTSPVSPLNTNCTAESCGNALAAPAATRCVSTLAMKRGTCCRRRHSTSKTSSAFTVSPFFTQEQNVCKQLHFTVWVSVFSQQQSADWLLVSSNVYLKQHAVSQHNIKQQCVCMYVWE